MSARVAARGEGVAVFNARHPVRWGLAPDFSALALRRSEFQTLEVLPDGLAKALAARDGRTAGHHEDEIAARRAAHFPHVAHVDQKSTRLNSSHSQISYAVFCLKKKKNKKKISHLFYK